MGRRRRKRFASPFYIFALIWLISSGILPLFTVAGFLLILGFSILGAVIAGAVASNKAQEQEKKAETVRRAATIRKTDSSPSVRKSDAPAAESTPAPAPAASAPKKSYGPEIDPIVQEGNRALSEMGRLYTSIKDPEVRQKINEIMRITDKITQDAIADPSDIPQIKKFMNYYLPTTIKLLNAYDRMSAQGIEGENLTKSMNSINEMLDAAIVAYKKRLDSLFANQALDIETDIQVMNTMHLGHSCFRLNEELVIDPYKDGSVPGLKPLRVTGKKVICSHEHADHSGRECVEIIPGECSFGVKEVPSFHDDKGGALRGSNTIFAITSTSGEKIVHLGDLGHYPNDEQLAAISDADYLLIPVGGYYTIDAKMAVKICEACRPKCIIPMHYRTVNSGYPELATVDEFLRLAEEAGILDKVKVMEKA